MRLNQVQYDPGEIITSNLPSDGVIVLDVNLQGVMELAPHTERFMNAFPATYRSFMKRILNKEVAVGEVLWYKEDDYTIALLITAERIFGKHKDDKELLQIYMEEAINNLLDQAQEDVLLFGMINRCVGQTGQVINYLNKKLTTQSVYMYRR